MSFDQLMKDLMEEYIAELPEKINTIQSHFQEKNLPALKDDFHKLKGTGKTYGLPEISDLGAVMEDQIEKGLDDQLLLSHVNIAIGLLNDIHTARKQEKSVDIEQDDRFQKIKGLL